MLKEVIYNLLPGPIRIQGRSFFSNLLHDGWDILADRVDPRIPPRCLNVSGDGPFLYLGEENLKLCIDAGLEANDTVLDLGCGIGRTALAMKHHASPGSYIGLDVIKFAITWCRKHIQAYDPRFSFVHADLLNRTYNPRGRIRPEHYRFPFEPDTFDFVLATSLFTHILPATTENYLRECARVLRPGAKFLSTWFLLSERERQTPASGPALFGFQHKFENYYLNNIHAPEQAVAYDSGYIQRAFVAAGFAIEHIGFGHWSGAFPSSKSGQDVIVARRGPRPARTVLTTETGSL